MIYTTRGGGDGGGGVVWAVGGIEIVPLASIVIGLGAGGCGGAAGGVGGAGGLLNELSWFSTKDFSC